MLTINLLTKNSGKIATAQSAFSGEEVIITGTDKEYHEIQADSSKEVALQMATAAAKELGVIAVREDHSLFLNGLGVPGPYMNFFEKKVSKDMLIKLLKAVDDYTGYFELALACVFPDGKTLEYSYQVPIKIKKQEVVADSRGGWNGIICLENENRAFTEYPEAERIDVWNKNFLNLAKDIK